MLTEHSEIDGVSAVAVAKKLGVGEEGGKYAIWDDGNSAWEDTPFSSDDEVAEAIWWAEDARDGFRVEKKTKDELQQNARNCQKEFATRIMSIAFRSWQRKWRCHFWNMEKKYLVLSRDGPPTLVYDPETAQIHDVQPPHTFFSTGERAMMRNVWGWGGTETEDDAAAGWYTLPGPGSWWPDDYDFSRHGFDLPNENLGQLEAWQLVWDGSYKATGIVPRSWERTLPSDVELAMVSNTIEGNMLLDLHDRLLL